MSASIQKELIVPLCTIVAGLILIIFGVASGEAAFGLLLIVPFVIVSGPIPGLGVLLVFAGIFMFQFRRADVITSGQRMGEFGDGWRERDGNWGRERTGDHIGYGRTRQRKPVDVGSGVVQKKRKGGGIIFIGPIPIIFGDSESIRYLVPIGIALLLLLILVNFMV